MPNFRFRYIIIAVQIIVAFIPFWQSTNGSPYNMLVISVYGVLMVLGICIAAAPIAGIIVLYVSVRDARLARREEAAAAHRASTTATAIGTRADDAIRNTEHREAALGKTQENEPRYLFVVSARHGRSYEAVRARSGLDDDAPWINFNRTSPLHEFPMPSRFIRHYAVCLFPCGVYETPGLVWREGFRSATFWDLMGPGIIPGEEDGVRWTDRKIESIDGILYVGLTEASDEEISTEFYRPLKSAWQAYDPVWWNSFDFANRLAYLLVHDESSTKNLQYLIEKFALARSNRVDLWPAILFLFLFVIAIMGSMVALFFERQPEALYLLAMGSACFLVVIGFFFASFWTSRRAEDKEGPVLRRRNEELVAQFEVLGELTQGVELVRRGWK
ncbi:hypothetical protein BJX62DRAFT_245531 [Aspergillus germanicus]